MLLRQVCEVKRTQQAWLPWAAAGILGLALATLLVFRNCSRQTSEPSGDARSATQTFPPAAVAQTSSFPFADTEGWTARLRTRAEVRFVPGDPEAPPEEPWLPTLTSLGPLEGAELVTLKSFADSLYTARAKALSDHQAQMDPTNLRDARTEAECVYRLEAALAIQQAIAAGHYIVLPKGQEMPQGSAEELTRWGCTKDGQRAVAWFVLGDKEYPALAEIRRYVATAATAFREDVVNRFNGLPLAQRQSILERKRDLDAAGPSSWTPEDMDFVQRWFPDFVATDPQNATMRATRP